MDRTLWLLALPAAAVDRLRVAAGTLIADSPVFKRLLQDAGARLVRGHS